MKKASKLYVVLCPGVYRSFAVALFATLWLSMGLITARANVPGGILSGTNPDVTLVDNGSTVTISNGIVSIQCTKSSAVLSQISYTYNNGSGTTTTQLLSGGHSGGEFYWECGGFTGSANNPSGISYSVAVDPAVGDAHHAVEDYAEISLLGTSSTAGTVEIHFSMLRGSPGFYATAIWNHRAQDAAISIGETRSNIYNSPTFNWMTADSNKSQLMEIPNGSAIAVPTGPAEITLWTSGIYKGYYDDKYKNSAILGLDKVWGYSSVGASGHNIGLWNVTSSIEYYNGGPLKRELTCQVIPDILNMYNGNHYWLDSDIKFAAAEAWTKTYGPYFIYCNNVPTSTTDEPTAAQNLYADAAAQQAAEATAWPYSWLINSNYAPPSGRGPVTGKIVISDTGNPTASAANLWVGVVKQPTTSSSAYDYQAWMKPYQFWTRTAADGSFTIPAVISGSNYTFYAFGPGSPGTFMSQNQTGGNPPWLFNLPASPFSVTVTGGSTTNLGNVTWTPTRVGPTVFEIGYPDHTSAKFRHGDDYWVGDIGPSSTTPSPIWGKFMEYQFDFPNGMNYIAGSSRWSTDWDYVQPTVQNSSGSYVTSTGTINFILPSAPPVGSNASIYIGLASSETSPTVVKVNGTNLGSASGVTATPSSISSSGFTAFYNNNDTTWREGNNSMFCDERITFPVSLLKSGTNNNTIAITDNGSGNIGNHIMYDYVRLEVPGYVPPAPATTTAYAGINSALVSWPVTPGATSYNISRSTVSGGSFSTIAQGITGPICGSGTNNATWVDTTASNGITYYYEVQSVNPAGTSGLSPQSAAVIPSVGAPGSVPGAPAGLNATAGSAQVSLSWTPVTGANYYTVQRSTLYNNGGNAYNILGTIMLSNTVTSPGCVDQTVDNGTIYSYTISAANIAGLGPGSTTGAVSPVAAAPSGTPTLTVSPGVQQVTLNWTAVPNAQGYAIYVATSLAGTYSLIGSVTDLTYTDSGLANNTTYYFKVIPISSGGVGTTSSIGSATTTPAPPSSLTATPGNTQATLTWPAVTSATGYSIQRGTTSGGSYSKVGTSVGPSYSDTGLTNGTPYYYVVASVNANGTGSNSVQATATPISTVPLAPTGLTATTGSTQVTLNWTQSSGATSYVVRSSTVNGGPYTIRGSGITPVTYIDSGLTSGTTYYYVVSAVNASGTSAYSKQIAATPNNGLGRGWFGGVSNIWDTTTLNWKLSGSSVAYADGDTATFDDTAATSNVVLNGTFNPASVTFSNNTSTYTLTGSNGGMISGATGLAVSGSGNVVLVGTNLFTGSTVLNSGTLTLASQAALLNSTINYNNPGGTLRFGPITSATIGALSGNQALVLTNTSGAGMTLNVGINQANTTYLGSLSGTAGNLVKVGSQGTMILTGSTAYVGGITSGGGVLTIGTGGNINCGTAAIPTGELFVNGGILTSNGVSNITAKSTGLLVNSGTASYLAGLTTDTGANNNLFIGVSGGVLNLASLFLGRTNNTLSTQPTAGLTTTGLYITGGVVAISGSLSICTDVNSVSTDSVRIDAGQLTINATSIVTVNSSSRWSVLDVNGGTFSSNDSIGAGIQLGGVFAGENAIMLVRDGTATANQITFGDANQTSGEDLLNVTGGVLYLGGGGMALGGTGGYTSVVTLSGTGTLGAVASWSSPVSVVLGGDTIQAGDSTGNAFNITLSGSVTGSTLIKTGNGTLTLSGLCNYTGATTVTAGILQISGTESGTSSVSIASGASLYLAGGQFAVSGGIINNGIFKLSGTPAFTFSGTFVNNGVLDLINGPATLPANLTNNGVVLTAGNVSVQQASLSGNNFNVQVQSYAEHSYQLQRSTTLTSPTWTNVGSAQQGTGGVLILTDMGGATSTQGFYRVLVGP